MRKKRKNLILLCSLMMLASPVYAENETEAVSVMDAALAVEETIEAETGSRLELDTLEPTVQEAEDRKSVV